MKFLFPLLLTATSAFASVTTTYVFPAGVAVPDNSIIGLADTREIAGTAGPLQHLVVSLELADGWNGDLYAHIIHDSGFAVLLNRIGRTAAFTVGSGTSGLQAVFDDSAPSDIHLVAPTSGIVAGIYQPDARTADPDTVTDSSTRSAFLGSFAGLNPNGRWTLFLADLSPGGTSTLTSWSLQVTTVPEPGAGLLTVGGMFLILLARKRHKEFPAPHRQSASQVY
jgi:hypothetical protein